jgi:glycosyltransferase EpsE
MSKPKISVIMGIYNCESTLDEAIESILDQTFTDWEMIMCDDGSSDNTYKKAKEYEKKYPGKFTVIKNEHNMGLNITLNKCLELAKGEYIARMDGDDISLPERFEKEVEMLENHPEFAIISTPIIYFDENGDWGQGKAIEKPQISDFFHHAPFFCHAPCMVRREAYIKVGGYSTDKRTLRVEDCNLWYKMYAEGYRGYNLQEPLYKMRDDKNAYKRRTLKTRLNETYVVYDGINRLGLPKWYYIYVVKSFTMNVIKGLMPGKIYVYLHKRKKESVG